MKATFLVSFFFAILMQNQESFASINEPALPECPKTIDKGSDLYLDIMNTVPLEGKTYTFGETPYYALTRMVPPRAMHPSRKADIEKYVADLRESREIKWRAQSGHLCMYRYIKDNKEMELVLNPDKLQ